MERVSFEIERQDVVDALHAQADAHGRTVEAELAALVEQTYAVPNQEQLRRPPGYPPGMEPQPGEGVGSWMHRISRPGVELDLPTQGLFELRDPYHDPD